MRIRAWCSRPPEPLRRYEMSCARECPPEGFAHLPFARRLDDIWKGFRMYRSPHATKTLPYRSGLDCAVHAARSWPRSMLSPKIQRAANAGVRARGVVKIYGGRHRVLSGVELELLPGEVVGLIGP